ncbi:MAG: phosphoribosylformylglycinamidine synthase II, partial [Acidobacteria bacterium]|nr:phosphoribosylformylglycinamidine synthase II [Acidobacteriota bacterium]
RKLVLLGGLITGAADQLERPFGSSQFAKIVLKDLWGLPPALDMEYEKRVQEAARDIVNRDLAESAHDASDGGLAVTVAESSFGPARVGARVVLGDGSIAPHHLLFHEAPSRILLSVDPRNLAAVLELASRHGVEAPVTGETVEGQLSFRLHGQDLFTLSVEALYTKWAGGLEG